MQSPLPLFAAAGAAQEIIEPAVDLAAHAGL